MNAIKKILGVAVFLTISSALVWILINYYSVIFSKTVVGEVTSVEKLDIPLAVLSLRNQNDINSKVFSFAVGIRDKASGEIFTASSEDRQWAVVHAGQCAEAEFLPYPPWNFAKKGTYFGARLLRLYDCK